MPFMDIWLIVTVPLILPDQANLISYFHISKWAMHKILESRNVERETHYFIVIGPPPSIDIS